MSLYYHIGSSGAGKSTGVRNKIIKEAEKDKNRSFLFIVPEQFTLQTQREILEKSSAHGMMNIDALSFARLAHRVFEEQGVTLPQVLEDTGKSMIVKKIVLEHKDELTIYKNKVKKQGFIEEMKSLIAEFYQYRIDKERFEQMKKTAGDRKSLKAKLHDIEIIYDAFAKFIEGRFVMNEEVIDRMCDVALNSVLLKNAVIVLDGFTGFTPSQYNCIDCLMKVCADIHVVLTVDPELVCVSGLKKKKKYEDLFELSLKTIDKLERLATQNNIPSDYITYNDEKGRYRNNPSLAHLEQNLFRFPYTKSEDSSAITLLSAADTDEEAEFIVSKVRELVFENGIKYENIAVLAGDISSYGKTLEKKFINAGIPVFIDEKHSIAGMNAVEFIDSIMDTELSDYSYESIFRMLKTGFTGIEQDAVARAENYVLEHGIKGHRRWNREWKGEGKVFETLNETRVKVLSFLEGFRASEKKKPTVTERLTALYGILDECEVELKLYEISNELKLSENPADRIRGMELGQLFKTVVTVFERINSLLGPERMELKEFKDVLDTGFSEAKLRSIPGGADSIVVGDIERTRIDNKKVIFLAGCNDSTIPKNTSTEGLLNEFDRELFADNDIELSPTKRDNASLSEFYLYLALTKPSEKLFITYSRMAQNEKEARPSYLFARVMKLYNNLDVKKISEYEKDNVYRILGSDRGMTYVTGALREANGPIKENPAYEYLKEAFSKENYEKMLLIEEAASGKKKIGKLTESEAEALYGKVIMGSITRLQQFASCAFSHFAAFGLELKERKEYRIGMLELGTIYHEALQRYAENLKKNKIKWVNCVGEDREKREKEAIETALAKYDDILSSSKRLEYYRKSIFRVVSRTVDIVTKQIALGEFDVGYVEKRFKKENSIMSLNGVIDRLDIAKKNGKSYVRVIDYKTGKTEFDMELLKAGLQLQLAVYTTEAIAMFKEQGEDIQPAGMYYYRIDDPIIDAGADVEKERMKDLRLDGLTVDEDDIIGLHDSSLVDKDGNRLAEKSEVIKYEYTKEGHISKNSEKCVIPKDDFENIGRTADRLAGELAKGILEGNVAVNPYQHNNFTPCTYCPYINVCGFDRKRGDKYRMI